MAGVLLVLLVVVLAILLALLSGGRFGRLAERPLTGLWWLVGAEVAQALGSVIGGLVGAVYVIGMLVSAACVAMFLRRNLRRPGVGLLGLGFLGNALVVALNGAMPVSLTALARAGLPAELAADPRHEMITDGTRLPWLGDVIPVALPDLGQAISPGDLLVAAGAGLLVFAAMGGGHRRAVVRDEGSEAEPAGDHPAQ